jgi:prepilin-type N-terminal cleavage/methylation domain-containing protein
MNPSTKQKDKGFTIIELLVIMVIVGILAAIVAPGWLGFLNRQRLSAAQTQTTTVIREAQSRAKQQKKGWEVCIQDDAATNRVRWYVRPTPTAQGVSCASNPGPWQNLAGADSDKIAIDTGMSTGAVNGFYRIGFRESGWVEPPPAGAAAAPTDDIVKIVYAPRINRQAQTGGSRRCVAVATLLGALRTANDDECRN